MNKKVTFTPHIVALFAFYILGNGILILPAFGTNEFNFIAYIAAVVLMLLMYLLTEFIEEKVAIKDGSSVVLKIVCLFLFSAVAVLSLFIAAESFSSLLRFVSEVILLAVPKFFIAIILAITVLYFSVKRTENLLKFSLLSMLFSMVVVLFFFIVQVDKFDLRNIFIFRLPKIHELSNQLKIYLRNPIMHIVVLPFFLKQNLLVINTKNRIFSILMGGILLGISILLPILLFGAELSGDLDYPFINAVSTVTVGRLFTRLDGFAYYVCFVSVLIKITVCIKVAWGSISKINRVIDKS